MIFVTRLNGQRFAVNPDLLLKAETAPDTVLHMIDGSRFIVHESMDEISELIAQYRARVAAATIQMTEASPLAGNSAAATVTELRNIQRGDA